MGWTCMFTPMGRAAASNAFWRGSCAPSRLARATAGTPRGAGQAPAGILGGCVGNPALAARAAAPAGGANDVLWGLRFGLEGDCRTSGVDGLVTLARVGITD